MKILNIFYCIIFNNVSQSVKVQKDIKQDVKGIKTRWVQFSWNSETKNFAIHRNRFATNALDIENDHEALSQRGAQMMRTGDLRSALGLLNKAVEVFSRLQAERG